MRKAQINLYYVIISALAIAVLILGFMLLINLNKTEDDFAIINFENSLRKSVEKQSLQSFGSVTEKTLSLPANAEKVCFVDEDKEFNELVDRSLTKARNIYTDYNLFLSPVDDYMPFKVNNLILNEDNNPLCIKVVNGKIRLRLESYGGNTLVNAADAADKEVECISVSYNDEPDNSVDIVFLGSDYSDINSFSSDVNRYIQTFRTTEPFSYNLDKINFYRIDEFEDIGCKVVSYGLGGYVICEDYLAKQLASECPIDQIVILVKIGPLANLVRDTRSSAKGIVATINSGSNGLLLLHEFGHTFSNLADEYVDNRITNFDEEDYPNCDDAECNEWAPMIDGVEVGCFRGCSLSAYHRPTKDSIMNSLGTDDYGPINENEITKRLNVYRR